MNRPLDPNKHAGTGVELNDESDDAVIGRALMWSFVAIGVIVILIVVAGAAVGAYLWLQKPPEPVPTELVAAKARVTTHIELPKAVFTDITQEAGIIFVHENGAYGDKLLPETMGSGAAFFDYDNDGDQDLLLVNSCEWPWKMPPKKQTATMALYANDGTGQFSDVTAECGLNVVLFGMGVAVGDFDNDGWRDLFISAVGRNRLFRNNEGKFIDVTNVAGVAGTDEAWSTSCGWFDYNNDGLLDLFVCNYIRWSKEIDLALESTLDGVNRAYGPPTQFEGAFPFLYRNDGGGKFTDVTADARLHVTNPLTGVPIGKSLGVVFLDLDNDGWLDIVVANDTVQNQAFRNQRDGTFKEVGTLINLAFDRDGNATGAMGIDGANFRNDKSIGLIVGNFANESTSLYVKTGDAVLFTDEAMASGIGPQTRLELTFGMFFFDYDLDGRLDVFAANGHLEEEITKVQPDQRYAQPPQLFWNAGLEQTTEFLAATSDKVGPDVSKAIVGRGSTFADIDNDGDLDVLITSCGGAPRLLRNDQQLGHHWLRLKLVGKKCNRDAIGALIELQIGDEIKRQQVSPTRSYLCQSELPVTFGLGKSTQVDSVSIRWPDGSTQNVGDTQIDQLHVVEQTVNMP